MALRETSRALRTIIEIVIIVVVALLLSTVVRRFVVETYEVPTGSMIPTIEIGDRILSEKITYYTSEPQAGDIVTFTNPIDPETVLVKRTIAVAGDVVDIDDSTGTLYINGQAQDESYTYGKPTYELPSTYSGVDISYPYTVPQGTIWVMGDNRTNSSDSRYFGPVDVETVTGRVFFRYWPFDRFGLM